MILMFSFAMALMALITLARETPNEQIPVCFIIYSNEIPDLQFWYHTKKFNHKCIWCPIPSQCS